MFYSMEVDGVRWDPIKPAKSPVIHYLKFQGGIFHYGTFC